MTDISSIRFDNSGWTLGRSEINERIWVDDHGDELQLYFLDGRSELRVNTNDIDDVRGLYRSIAQSKSGGIVEVDLKQLAGAQAARTIMKFPQNENGVRYSGGLAFSFENFAFALSIVAQEHGITGMRETMLFDKLGCPSRRKWACDPYLSWYRKGLLRTLADDEEWDQTFEDHPLSRLRTKLSRVESTVEIAKEALDSERYISASESLHSTKRLRDKLASLFR